MRGSLLLATLLSSAGLSYASNDFGKRFLEENKARAGVVTLDSGLQYFVLEEGDGDVHPLRDTDCVCHYEGRTAQAWSEVPKGKKFDSSFDRGTPSNFAPSGVIRGWTEAMQMMVTGDKWELYIPSEMAYGEQGQGGDIGPGDVLVFTIEIIKIKGGKVPANKCDVKSLEGCTEKESTYITAKKKLDTGAIGTEVKRLEGMQGKAMAADKKSWLMKRLLLLRKVKDEL